MAAKPNDLAACQVTPGISEWILAKVLHHDPSSGTFQLSDEDVESNKSTSSCFILCVTQASVSLPTFFSTVFDLPESQVVVLSPIERLSKGDSVYAVYPDTTSFYPAMVVQATKKSPVVLVHFVDDADELGITHDKAVPLQHIMLPPASV
jgi:SGF29 tudor-like domain